MNSMENGLIVSKADFLVICMKAFEKEAYKFYSETVQPFKGECLTLQYKGVNYKYYPNKESV